VPQIDITSVLASPIVAGERFVVQRRIETVDQYGQSQIATQTYSAIGSIVPTGDNSLVREEAYQQQAKSITVRTTFRLRGAAKDGPGYHYQPDLVIWKGDAFIVRTVDDYSQYGAGMVEAACTSIDLIDQPSAGNSAAPVSDTFAVPGFSDQIPIIDGEG
jgi:hypothetical protein